MAYADTAGVHDPATGTAAPAAWGDQVRDNLEFLIDPPACKAKHSTTQTLVNNTSASLSADSEDFDNNAMHSTVTNNTRITIQTAGRYEFYANVGFNASSTGERIVEFRQNGTTMHPGVAIWNAGPGTSTGVILTDVFALTAGDYMEVRATQLSGGNLNAQLHQFRAKFITR